MRRIWLLLLILPGTGGVAADPDIYRCAQPDGTVAFQQMPCPDPAGDSNADGPQDSAESVSTDGSPEFTNRYDAAGELQAGSDPAAPAPTSRDRAECETRTRNAIDVIDLEMRKGFSKEQGERYLAELLELTQQLRACKLL